MKRTKTKIINNFITLNKKIDDDWQKLSDKYKNLKMSQKKTEKTLEKCRKILIAIQNGINICPKCVEETLRSVNLELGYNQWIGVKEISKIK